MHTLTSRTIICLLVVLCALASVAPTEAQTRTWGRLTTNSGPAPYDWEIAQWIDQYFEDGSPGNGTVTSNILYIETQCYEEAADNFNATKGEAVGDAATDTVSYTNTTYLAAQQPGVTSNYLGYHDDAAFGLFPGRTAAQVHTIGADGRNPRELPRIQGNFFRKVGGRTSTHILVWAGQPNNLDYLDVANILLNFEDNPNTTVDILYGDGTTDFGAGANSTGAATRANLRAKLQDIGPKMDDGSDEQFIFFVTDHGSRPSISATPVTAPPQTSGTTIDVNVPSTVLNDAVCRCFESADGDLHHHHRSRRHQQHRHGFRFQGCPVLRLQRRRDRRRTPASRRHRLQVIHLRAFRRHPESTQTENDGDARRAAVRRLEFQQSECRYRTRDPGSRRYRETQRIAHSQGLARGREGARIGNRLHHPVGHRQHGSERCRAQPASTHRGSIRAARR